MSKGAIEFVADSSQLVSAAAEARQSVASVAATAEQARQKIVSSYQAQVAAAKEAGASQRQLETITTRSANSLASVTEDSAKRYINAIDRMEDRTKRFNAARSSLASAIPQAPVSQFTFAGYSNAAKGAGELSHAIDEVGKSAEYSVAPSVRFGSVIRSMNGGFSRNIRSAEYFGASLKFLAPLMEAAFPVVGALTLGYALVEMGKHAYDAFENVVLLRDAIKGLNQLQINVDTTVNKNADAAEASVEAILNRTQGKSAADKQKYAYAQNKPLDNSSYFYSKEFSGLDSNIKANYENRFKSIAPGDIDSSRSAIAKEIAQLQDAKASAKTHGAFVENVGGYGPSGTQDPQAYFTARIKALQQIKTITDSGATARSASLQADQIAIPHDQAEEAKKRTEEGKQQRALALAAQREANAKAIAAQSEDYLEWSAVQNRSKLDEMLYWSSLVALRNDGSARALDATKKYNQANVALNRENAEAMKTAIGSFRADYMKDFYENSGLSGADRRNLNQSGQDASDYIASLKESIDLKQQDSDALAENAIQMAVATGQMTKLDAARATAALHQQQYKDSLADLNDQRAAINSDPTISSLQRKAQLQANANQTKSLNDNYGMQRQRDQQAIDPGFTSATVGAANALNEFVKASRDSAGMMKSVVTNTLTGLNGQIVNAMMGHKTNFGQVVKGAGAELGGNALKTIEGSALSKITGGLLGKGKVGESAGNPMFVSVVAAPITKDPLGAIGKLFGGKSGDDGGGDSGGSSVGSWIGKIGSWFTGNGKADGGYMDGPTLVGERGPEILNARGYVTPNNKLSIGGGGSNISYTIDARGTDPAQTEARVKTAIAQSHDSSVRQSLQQQHQRDVRAPRRNR